MTTQMNEYGWLEALIWHKLLESRNWLEILGLVKLIELLRENEVSAVPFYDFRSISAPFIAQPKYERPLEPPVMPPEVPLPGKVPEFYRPPTME